MEQLSVHEEMQVNQYLAKEFIESHLNITPNRENIQALATLIFDLEHKVETIY
jgi:hypothetical protein